MKNTYRCILNWNKWRNKCILLYIQCIQYISIYKYLCVGMVFKLAYSRGICLLLCVRVLVEVWMLPTTIVPFGCWKMCSVVFSDILINSWFKWSSMWCGTIFELLLLTKCYIVLRMTEECFKAVLLALSNQFHMLCLVLFRITWVKDT